MRRRRGGVRLTARGRAVLIIGLIGVVVAYATRVDVILFAAVMLIAAPVLALLAASHRRPRLAVHRTIGVDRAMAGHPVPVSLTVANRSLRAVGAATWLDEWRWISPAGVLARGPRGESEHAELPRLRGRWGDVHSSIDVGWEFEPPLRGTLEIGPVRVTVGDPFGLARATVVVGELTEVTVVPAIVALGDDTVALRRAEGVSQRAERRIAAGDHELTTRAYRPGDALRRVHWRASAHHGELMVRQEEQRSAAEATILLETRRRTYPDVQGVQAHESDSFEWAVSFVASLAVHLQSLGVRVSILETGTPQLQERAGASLDGLARVTLTSIERPRGLTLVPAGRQASSRLGTVYAVLGGGGVFAATAGFDLETATALANGRAPYDTAVAFVPASTPDSVYDRLVSAGWRCVPVTPDTGLADAWLAAGEVVDS